MEKHRIKGIYKTGDNHITLECSCDWYFNASATMEINDHLGLNKGFY